MIPRAYITVPSVGSGPKVANFAATLPVGTEVTNSDGSTTVLSAAATVYLQRVVVSDSSGNAVTDFAGPDRWDEVLDELRRIRRGVGKMAGDPFLYED